MSFILGMTVLDWICVVILVASIVSSIIKGFAREAISLASVVVGLLLASWFYHWAGNFYLTFVKTEDIAWLLGFFTIFAGCVLAGSLISWLTNRLIKMASLAWFDRLLGAAFGLIRGWLVGSVLFLMLTAFPIKLNRVEKAQLAPYLLAGARVLAVVTPKQLKAKFLEGYRQVEKLWGQTSSQS
jgi:membrane protein required for colicin V production